jgi:hypothetical protein
VGCRRQSSKRPEALGLSFPERFSCASDSRGTVTPVFYGVYPVGHGGTYNEDNGGPFGVAAVAWLKWQLMGDTSAKGKGYFVGAG